MFWVISQFFVYYITPCVFIHTFDVSMRIYNVNSCEIKETTLNWKGVSKFWTGCVCFFFLQVMELTFFLLDRWWCNKLTSKKNKNIPFSSFFFSLSSFCSSFTFLSDFLPQAKEFSVLLSHKTVHGSEIQ